VAPLDDGHPAGDFPLSITPLQAVDVTLVGISGDRLVTFVADDERG
jgi:hypothetical protein